jgi:hypothetical protein
MDLTAHEREEYGSQMGHVWQGFTVEQVTAWVAQAGLTVARHRVLPVDSRAKGPAVFTMVVRKDVQ